MSTVDQIGSLGNDDARSAGCLRMSLFGPLLCSASGEAIVSDTVELATKKDQQVRVYLILMRGRVVPGRGLAGPVMATPV